MAIKRCPYCKAIIDEEDKYCNNCGTQLLFPEDESIEEEIPGDKIIDEEDKSGEEEFLEEEEEEKEEQEQEAEEDNAGKDEELEPEIEEEEAESEQKKETAAEEGGEEEEFEEEEEGEEEEIEIPREEIRKDEETPGLPGTRFEKSEDEKKYKVSIEEDELVFKTKDLDQLTGTVDEGKKELEEFLGSFKKAEDEKKTTPAAREESADLFQEAEAPPGTREELPPWASGIREPPSAPVPVQPAVETVNEEKTTRPEWTVDSGIGIPEKITQKTLPFADTAAQKLEEERMRTEAPSSDEAEQRPAGFRSRLKAKLIDVVFITALWLISLWFTAQVIGVSFFRLIFGSPIPVLAFYVILLVLYFFLFLYFLGETLGDHYFSEESEGSHREE